MIRVFSPPLPDEMIYLFFEHFIGEGNDYVRLDHFVRFLTFATFSSNDEILELLIKVFDSNKDQKLDRGDLIAIHSMLKRFDNSVSPSKEKPKKDISKFEEDIVIVEESVIIGSIEKKRK